MEQIIEVPRVCEVPVTLNVKLEGTYHQFDSGMLSILVIERIADDQINSVASIRLSPKELSKADDQIKFSHKY